MITPDQFHYLQSTEGRALLAAIGDVALTPVSELAAIDRLRRHFPAEMVPAAMTVHSLRRRAAEKFSRADEMWFTRDGYEQATAEPIATYRAARFDGCLQVFDLCCGIGGDLIALSHLPSVEEVIAVDIDPLHLAMAALNARVYAATARVVTRLSNVETTDLEGSDGVFIDPARRTDRGRLTTGRSQPDLKWCLSLESRVSKVGIKAAPGVPRQLVPDDWELETIALGADLKEAVLWSPQLRRTPRRATVIEGDTVHSLEPVPGIDVAVRAPNAGDVLFDPNPAVTRAGLVDDLARSLAASKIDARIGFLVSDRPAETPFARSCNVLSSLPWHERRLQDRIRDLDGGEVTVRRRGLAGDVDAIQRRLRGTGSRSLFIAMTRVNDQPWAIVCESPQPRRS